LVKILREVNLNTEKTIGTSHKNTANFLPLNLKDKFYSVPKVNNYGMALIFSIKSKHKIC